MHFPEETMSEKFKFTNYDVIAFDLDNTLFEYNLTNLITLQYEYLSNYLIQKKGYSRKYFPTKLSDEDKDFFQRGLFLDINRGNILHLRHDGVIIKATHGTKTLTNDDIERIYGRNKKWSALEPILNDVLTLWDNKEMRTFLDFTDSIASLLFAKAVDSLESKCDVNKVWPDLLESIIEMYKIDSSYIKNVDQNILNYASPCTESVMSWLKELKKHSKLLIITGALKEIAKVTLSLCFGENYSELFDLIICDAKKPGFFSMKRPFLNLEGERVTIQLESSESNIFRVGNWEELHDLLEDKLGKKPRCLYVGDNPVQDIYAPNKIPLKLDTVAIIEEIAGENLNPETKDYPHSPFVTSKFWGPFLHTEPDICTLMGGIYKNCSKMVFPSVKVMAKNPIDQEYETLMDKYKLITING